MPEALTESTSSANPEGAAAPEAAEESRLGEGGVAALKAEREARKLAEKRAADAEAKVAEAERAKLGEKERAEAERDDARKEAAQTKAENARLRIGLKYKQLSGEDIADISTEGSVEDFEARVARLAQRLGGTSTTTTTATTAARSGLPESPNAHRDGGTTTASVQAGRDAYAARKNRAAS